MAAALEILKKASAPGSSATAPPSIPVPTLGTRKSIIPPPTVAPRVKQTVIKFSDTEFTEDDRKVMHSVYENHVRANDNDLRPECREHILILADTLDEEKSSPAHALDRQNLFIFIKRFDNSSHAFVRLDSKDAFHMYGAKTLVSTMELATIVLGERFWSGSVHLLERSLQRFISCEHAKGSITVALEDIETYDELATHYLEHANAFSLHKQLAEAEGTGKIGVCARRSILNTTNTVTFACMAHPKMLGHLWVGRYRFVAGPKASAATTAKEDSTPAPVSKPEPAHAATVAAIEAEPNKSPEAVVATPAKEDQVMKEKEEAEEEEEESLALDGDIESVDRDAENNEEEGEDEKDKHDSEGDGGEESNNNNDEDEEEDDEKSAEPEPGSGSAKRKKSITWDADVKEPRGPAVPKSKRNQSVGGGVGNGRRKAALTAEEVEARREERRAKDREAQRIKRATEKEARELAKAKKESLASAYLAEEVAKAERAKEKKLAAKKQESAAPEEDDFESEEPATASKRKTKAPAASSAPKRGKRAKADKSEVIDVDSSDGEEQEKKKEETDKPKEADIPQPPPSIDGSEAQRRSRLSIPHNIFAKPRYEVKLVRDEMGRPSRPIRFVMQDNTFPPTARTILTPELGPVASQVRFELESRYTGLDVEEIERIMAIVQRPPADSLTCGPGYWFFSMQANQAGDIIVEDCGRAVLMTDDTPPRTLKGPQLVPYIDDISALYELRGIGYARQQLETAHQNSAQ